MATRPSPFKGYTFPKCICPACDKVVVAIPKKEGGNITHYEVRAHEGVDYHIEVPWSFGAHRYGYCKGSHQVIQPATEQQLEEHNLRQFFVWLDGKADRLINELGAEKAILVARNVLRKLQEGD